MSRICRPASDHRSFTDSSAVAELRRTTRAGAAFHHEFTGRGRGWRPLFISIKSAIGSRGMREPPSGAAWHGSSLLALGLTSPLPAARRFRKLSIIEQGVHQTERYPGNEGFRVRGAPGSRARADWNRFYAGPACHPSAKGYAAIAANVACGPSSRQRHQFWRRAGADGDESQLRQRLAQAVNNKPRPSPGLSSVLRSGELSTWQLPKGRPS
jgi:hypothetical protein